VDSSAKTAEHHEIHLKRIHRDGKLPLNITGFKIQGEMQAIAFMVVTDENMIQVRDASNRIEEKSTQDNPKYKKILNLNDVTN
jgi:hypothetical protein